MCRCQCKLSSTGRYRDIERLDRFFYAFSEHCWQVSRMAIMLGQRSCLPVDMQSRPSAEATSARTAAVGPCAPFLCPSLCSPSAALPLFQVLHRGHPVQQLFVCSVILKLAERRRPLVFEGSLCKGSAVWWRHWYGPGAHWSRWFSIGQISRVRGRPSIAKPVISWESPVTLAMVVWLRLACGLFLTVRQRAASSQHLRRRTT